MSSLDWHLEMDAFDNSQFKEKFLQAQAIKINLKTSQKICIFETFFNRGRIQQKDSRTNRSITTPQEHLWFLIFARVPKFLIEVLKWWSMGKCIWKHKYMSNTFVIKII